METSSSVLVDRSLYPRTNNASAVYGFNGGSNSSAFLLGSASQRRLNVHGAGAAGSLGPHPLAYAPYPVPGPTYSSLPTPSLLQHRPSPPLLPLPMSKSIPLPSPSPPPSGARMVSAAIVHSVNKDQKKPRSSPAIPRKDPQRGAMRPQKVPTAGTPPGRVPKPAAAATSPIKGGKTGEEDEGGFTDDVYALSPPPSSLPIPSFALRVRMPSATCNAEAFGGRGAPLSGADPGASDGLRRLLRL